ncbi:MAG: ATP-binding protein [Alphaproteobacteria bacterium]
MAIAVGRAAIVAGDSVPFTPATTLVARLATPELVIVDERGHLPVEPDAAPLFVSLASRRYARGAMLLTSNRAVGGLRALAADASFDRDRGKPGGSSLPHHRAYGAVSRRFAG